MTRYESLGRHGIILRDLRTTCYHEAAHYVLAVHFGADAWVEIEPTNATDLLADRAWTGRCRFDRWALSDDELRLVGLAGLVMELLLDNPDCDGDDFWCILDDPDVLSVSETDQARFEGAGYEDLEACVGIVRAELPAIREFAQQMIDRYQRLIPEIEAA